MAGWRVPDRSLATQCYSPAVGAANSSKALRTIWSASTLGLLRCSMSASVRIKGAAMAAG